MSFCVVLCRVVLGVPVGLRKGVGVWCQRSIFSFVMFCSLVFLLVSFPYESLSH